MCVYNNDCKLMLDSCNSGIGKDGYFNEQEESKDNKMKDRRRKRHFSRGRKAVISLTFIPFSIHLLIAMNLKHF